MEKISLALLGEVLKEVSNIEEITVVDQPLDITFKDYFGIRGVEGSGLLKAGVYLYGEVDNKGLQPLRRYDDEHKEGEIVGYVSTND